MAGSPKSIGRIIMCVRSSGNQFANTSFTLDVCFVFSHQGACVHSPSSVRRYSAAGSPLTRSHVHEQSRTLGSETSAYCMRLPGDFPNGSNVDATALYKDFTSVYDQYLYKQHVFSLPSYQYQYRFPFFLQLLIQLNPPLYHTPFPIRNLIMSHLQTSNGPMSPQEAVEAYLSGQRIRVDWPQNIGQRMTGNFARDSRILQE